MALSGKMITCRMFQGGEGDASFLAANIYTHERGCVRWGFKSIFTRKKDDDELYQRASCVSLWTHRVVWRRRGKWKYFPIFSLLWGASIRFQPMKLIQIVEPEANKCSDLSLNMPELEMCETLWAKKFGIPNLWKSPVGRILINVLFFWTW